MLFYDLDSESGITLSSPSHCCWKDKNASEIVSGFLLVYLFAS